MKDCSKCGETKSLDDFYLSGDKRRAANSRATRCKECVTQAQRVRRGRYSAERIEVDRIYNRIRRRIDRESPELRRKKREYDRRRWELGLRQRPRDPLKRKAHRAVQNAVKGGRLVPPDACEDCGHDFSTYRRHAHHDSYKPDQRLVVDWLCAACHGKRHRKYA